MRCSLCLFQLERWSIRIGECVDFCYLEMKVLFFEGLINLDAGKIVMIN